MLTAAEVLTFEIGGTTLRAGLYCPGRDAVDAFRTSPVPNHLTMPEASGADILECVIAEIVSVGQCVLAGRRAETVVIAFPGPIDPAGRILAAPTVWGDRMRAPINLAERLRYAWPDADIVILNDVTAAGYHFLRHPLDDLGIVNVGSGIGNKVFIRGMPVVGVNGLGGEVGHVRVDFSDDAPVCECGHRGHLGAVASGRASAHLVRRLALADRAGFVASVPGRMADGRPEAVTNEMIAEAATLRDRWTLALVATLAKPLGWLLAATHLAVGIERFVITGGFARALGEPYRVELARAAAGSSWPNGVDWAGMIELGTDERAALRGAGRFVSTGKAATR